MRENGKGGGKVGREGGGTELNRGKNGNEGQKEDGER